MTEVADLYVLLRANTRGFSAAMTGAAAEGEGFTKKMLTGTKQLAAFGVVGTTALLAVGAKSIDMGAKFQRSMEQIHTLAHVSQDQIAGLSGSVLKLAGQVGYGPTSLAEALYHIESNFASVGLGGAKALEALKVAAQGAQIGNANLVDVTNALGAAVASGIGGVKDYSKAMGSLLAIVGSGDMQMQDLANAFSTGILAISKQYGATLNDVGAALATFGDNNIRGQVAATDLRMAIMDLTKQGKPGVAALASIGIAAGRLGRDMQTGGMNKALIDLRDHLNKAGITGVHVGRFLEDAFTKKSSAPLAILMGQFSRLESKYPEMTKGASSFGSAWQSASAGAQIQVEKMKARIDAFLTGIGLKLLPLATRALNALNTGFDWLGRHKTTLYALGASLGGVLATGLAAAAVAAWSFLSPFLMVAVPIAAVAAGLYVLWTKCAAFRDIVGEVATTLRTVLGTALAWMSTQVKAVLGFASQWWADHGRQVKEAMTAIWAVIKADTDRIVSLFHIVWPLLKTIVEGAWRLMKDTVATNIRLISDVIGLFIDFFTGHWSHLWSDAKKLVSDGISGIGRIVRDWASTAGTLLLQAGKDLIQGLINGVKSMAGNVGAVMKDTANSLLGAFHIPLKIHSPSRVFYESGQNIVRGLIGGIRDTAPQAMLAMDELAKGVQHRHRRSHAQVLALHAAATGRKHHRHDEAVARAERVAALHSLHMQEVRFGRSLTADRRQEQRTHHLLPHNALAALLKIADQLVARARRTEVATRGTKQHTEAVSLLHRALTEQKQAIALGHLPAAHHKAAAAAAAHHATAHSRHINARQSYLRDMPTLLSLMSGAGLTSNLTASRLDQGMLTHGTLTRLASAGGIHHTLTHAATPRHHHTAGGHQPAHGGAPIHLHLTVQSIIDGHVISEKVQRHQLQHERRNVNNGLSRYTRR